jgi:hypothetical protein
MARESATTPVLRGAPTASSPPGWCAGAGDNHDHAIRSWTPDESDYLSTVCGRPSAQAGRTVNQPCPAFQQGTLSTRQPAQAKVEPHPFGQAERFRPPTRSFASGQRWCTRALRLNTHVEHADHGLTVNRESSAGSSWLININRRSHASKTDY